MTSPTTIPDLSNPFPGLRCFLSEEDYLFFGRHEQIEDLLRRLRTNRLVAVVGTSGSGKSSLVRAGLLPAVLGGGMAQAGSDWEIAVMRPGGSPMAHLARALCETGLYDADAEDALFHLQATLSRSRNGLIEAVRQSRATGSRLLLVVDQFEELFRFNRASATSQEEAIGFVNLLLHATQQADQNVFVVLTMRSDFLGECSQFLGLAEAVNDGEFLIPRMTRDQIQEAIEGPIRVRGAEIAPRLLFRLLNDVQDDQDQLPVLQHALMRTWNLWQRSQQSGVSPLDLEHYEATGGMQEALSRHADEIFDAFPSEPHRTASARLFKALTERGPDGRGIRRPTRLGQLVAIAAVEGRIVREVIEAYRTPGVTFLMPPVSSTLDDTTVIDISHESLMRVWNRLRGWVETEAQSARIYRRLHETAALHAENRAGLYHDPDLQIALSWREASGPNSAWADQYGGGFDEAMAFLDTSREAAGREEKEREAARQRELKGARQLAETQARAARLFKRFAVGLAVGLCLAVALTVWAFLLRQEAKRQEAAASYYADEATAQAKLAEANARKAEKEAVAARTAEKDARERATAERAAKAIAQQETQRAKEAKAIAQQERQRADDNARKAEKEAVAARAAEAEAKVRAKAEADAKARAQEQLTRAEWLVYAGKLMLAQTDFEAGNGGFALKYLDECQGDLRGWEHRYLWTRINAKQTLRGDTDGVWSVCFSPDGKRIVIGSQWTAKVWDAGTGQEVLALKGHKVPVRSVAWSPDGQRIVTGAGDPNKTAEAKVWDANTGREQLALKGFTGEVWSVCFSPDGQRIVTGDGNRASGPGEAKVWDANTGRKLLALKGHRASVRSVAWSPDGKRIVTGAGFVHAAQTGEVKVWDAATGQVVLTLKGHTDGVHSVAWSPDGQRIVTGAGTPGRGEAKVWDANTGRELLALKGHTDWVGSVSWSPDGQRIISGSADNTGRVWDAETGQELLALKGHTGQVSSVAYSPDGQRIVSGSDDQTARVWDAVRGQMVLTLKGHTNGVIGAALSPDGQRIVTGSFDNTARVWVAATGRELLAIKGLVYSVAWSPDGKRIVTGEGVANNNAKALAEVKVWDAGTGQKLLALKGHTGWVRSVCFSLDGKRIVSGSDDQTAKVWNAETGLEVLTLKGHTGWVWSVAFSRDGKRIVSGSFDNTAKVWDAQTGRELLTLKGHTAGVSSVAWSPDGKRIVTGSWDKTAKVWEAEKGQEVLTLKGHKNWVNGVCFSPDGQRIVTASEDKTVKVWEVPLSGRFPLGGRGSQGVAQTGLELLTLKGHTSVVYCVAFSPDGKRLVTGSYDKTAKVWDAEKGQALFKDSAWPLPDAAERKAYHTEQATLAVQQKQWFAAEFHLGRVLRDDPESAAVQPLIAALLKERVPALLQGKDEPGNNAERLAVAQIASHRKQFATATRLWSRALESDPKLGDDRQIHYRYNAARAAALAAAGLGQNEPPLDNAAKAKLRQQALDWLKAELNAWSKVLDSGLIQVRPAIAQTLSHWQKDIAMSDIRDERALVLLPAEEHKAFTQLWADVAVLLKMAREKPK